MKTVVIYGSRHGNTERIARAITFELAKHGEAHAVPVDQAPATFADVDLVVVGGPTEAHGVTPAVKDYLRTLTRKAVTGKAAAAFDTRLHGARWLTGAAGDGITRELETLGAHMVARPESFEVSGKDPILKPGEADRAAVWAAELAAVVERSLPVTA